MNSEGGKKEKMGSWEGGKVGRADLRSLLPAPLPARRAYRPEGGALIREHFV